MSGFPGPDDFDDGECVCAECGGELPNDGTSYQCRECAYEEGFL